MPGLSPVGQDRLLMFGLGLSTCAVIGLMRHMLVRYRDSAIEKPVAGKPQYITQEVEDSLKLSTLDKLLNSPSYGITETTTVIVCERALYDGTSLDVLLWYITQPDHDTREQGIRALMMVLSHCSATASMLNTPKTYAALVRSLEYSRTDYSHHEYDPDWDNWVLRDVNEQGCLLILAQLVDRYGVEGLVRARFVERWLAKEPWGGTDDDDRQLAFMDSLSRDNRLNDIAMPLFRDEAGRKALESTKLLPPKAIDQIDEMEDFDFKDVRMVGGEGTAGEDDSILDGFIDGFRRPRDQSAEEEHLRRRHREAMVLNDGTRPLERGDIIERQR
ncbi:cytoskeleton-associated protein [Phlyctema vagabunda]|uniref:Cytoskeleton-associated protein n=1 Tax=Phlyctema vagabunda TaxID=108571 RepID=A0ABR4P7S2_9HELO